MENKKVSKSKSQPKNAKYVRTYAELRRYATAFAAQSLSFIILLGKPGIGKSHTFRDCVGPSAAWIDGNASPFGIYCEAYRARNEPIVLDDVDGLYSNKDGVRLLKTMCQSDARKYVGWHSDAPTLKKEGIPKRFETTSPVALIANAWSTANANVRALEDRAHVVVFEPSHEEIHERAAAWYWDQEVFDFVADHLQFIDDLSFRLYKLASERKQAGLDWQEFVLSRCFSGTRLVVARLILDDSFALEEDRASAFIATTGQSRATYFNHARRVRVTASVRRHVLTSPPPSRSSLQDDVPLDDEWSDVLANETTPAAAPAV